MFLFYSLVCCYPCVQSALSFCLQFPPSDTLAKSMGMSGEMAMAKPSKKKNKSASRTESEVTISQTENGPVAASGEVAPANKALHELDAGVTRPETTAEINVAGGSYKKKLKKKKRAAAAAAGASGPAENDASPTTAADTATPTTEAATSSDAASIKDAKRAAKKARKASAAAAASAAGDSEPPADTQGAPNAALSKKERKQLAASDAGAAPNAAVESNSEQPKAKRPKLSKSSAQGKGNSSRKLAAVGDAALARSSKPIVRSTYIEHGATAAQTDSDVTSLRDSRATTITGIDWKPIREFAHSGNFVVSVRLATPLCVRFHLDRSRITCKM